ncbi:MAG: protein translocase subunit SecD [Actinomycetota bacterium]|nr:protein translocase subunit SecD [Actinomycetota bacterium]
MAPPTGTLRVGRYFLSLLAILAVLYSIVFWPGARHTPKLGLDLVGGTQVIFTAKTPNGSTPSKSQMNQAKTIMENRVNGSGVTQSTVVIQGSNQIVISIPGGTNTSVADLGKAAVLAMRGNVMPAVPVTCGLPSSTSASASASPSTTTGSGQSTGSAGATGSPTVPRAGTTAAAPKDARSRLLIAPTTPAATPGKPAATSTATPTPSSTNSPARVTACVSNPLAGAPFPIPTTDGEYNKLTQAQQLQLQQALATVNCFTTANQSDTAKTYIACDKTQGIAYLLGPVIVAGQQISSASSQAPNVSSGQTEWTVQLQLKNSGQAAWASYTGAHNVGSTSPPSTGPTQCSTTSIPCADFVGFVLDGDIISAPVNESAINGQTTQITGSFTQSSANKLANELKYGALPLSFTAQDAQTISATLGTSQLKAGLLAGGIGLILVVIYSLIYYRALGFVTIASLLVSGALTYACLVILATQIKFTLSLAGIAGFIVAVGITADSFVVFFERIKDEVHEGRSARVAIPRAWIRARRTILSADTVSFLAAAILYYFAAGDVKGFAFTLGLSTILDLVVVFLFTHPLVSLLSRLRMFGSSAFTGLDAIRGGVALADAPAPRRPRAAPKRARGGPVPTPAPEPEPLSRSSSVAVLDGQPLDGDVDQLPDLDDAIVEPPAEAEVAEPAPGARPATTPAPGSAAERAAARRARMRAEKGEN